MGVSGISRYSDTLYTIYGLELRLFPEKSYSSSVNGTSRSRIVRARQCHPTGGFALPIHRQSPVNIMA